MDTCPLCGQPIPQDIVVDDEIALGDPQIAEPLGEFIRMVGLSKTEQRKLNKFLSVYSTRAITYALKVFEQKGILKNSEIGHKVAYFKAVVRKRHEEIEHEVDTCAPSLDFDPNEWES